MKPLTYLLIDFENVQPPAGDVALVRGDDYRLLIFRGPHQIKYDAEIAEAWQPLGQHVSFVRSSKAGKNALDFHISFALGRLCAACAAAQRPARFVVVSKDGGFDALFEYMSSSLGVDVNRAPSIPQALTLVGALAPAVPAHFGETPVSASASAAPSAAKQPTAATEGAAKTSTKKPAKKSAKTSANEPTNAAKPVTAANAVAKVIAYLRAHPANRPTTPRSLENHIPSMVGGTMAMEAVKALVSKLVADGVVTVTGKQLDYKMPKGGK